MSGDGGDHERAAARAALAERDGCGCPDCDGRTTLTAEDREKIADLLNNAFDLAHPLAVRIWRALRAAEAAHEQDSAAVRALVDTLPRCTSRGIVRGNADDDRIIVLALRVLFRKTQAQDDDLTENQWSRAGDILEALTRRDRSDGTDTAELPYAAPLRALLARMATWPTSAPALTCRLCGQSGHTELSCLDTSDLAGHVAPDAPPAPLTAARAERDRLRARAEEAQGDYMRAECHARALGAELGEARR